MEKHPEDELPIAALQCAVIALAAVTAASVDASAAPWALPWDHLLTATANNAPAWGVPAAIAYTGLISTSLTIWLTAKVFSKLPSTDASIILASEPLWATAVAVGLLHARRDLPIGLCHGHSRHARGRRHRLSRGPTCAKTCQRVMLL